MTLDEIKKIQVEIGFDPNITPPAYWNLILKGADGGAWALNGLLVVVSGEKHEGKRWLHVSFSRKNRIPEYKDLQRVKRDFIGDMQSIMVFPKEDNYVNKMKTCLHLYACLDGGDGLPDFTAGTGNI